MYDEARCEIEKIEKRFSKRIVFRGKSDYHLEQFEINSSNGQFSFDKKETEIL
jgi:hypothetical protein